MKILATNDDGIEDAGLWELVKSISGKHEIHIIAPDRRYSGYSGAISFCQPIAVKKYPLYLGEAESYIVSGTPADCIMIGLDELVGKVDLVISGINDEPNLGDDIRFSATLGACREAAFSDTPAIGLSIDYGSEKKYYHTLINFLDLLLEKWNKLKIPKEVYLNINCPNIPISQIKGALFVPAGRCRYRNRVQLVGNDPEQAYKIHGSKIDEEEINTDSWAIKNGYISITPLHRDQTDKEILSYLDNLKISFI